MAESTVAEQRARELIDALWNDGEVGERIQKAAKERWPEIPVAREFVEPLLSPLKKQNDDLAAELKAIREERDADRKAADERKAEAEKKSFEEQIEQARKNYNLTEEGFDKMVARMKLTGNYSDPDAAAAWVASKTPAPSPINTPSFGPQSLNLFGSQSADENMAALHRDPMGYMDSQLNEFVRDPDRYVRETFGA